MANKLARSKNKFSYGSSANRGSGDGELEEPSRLSNGPNIYQLGAEIGRGGFAVVFQAFNVNNGDFVAMKRFPLHSIDKESLSNIETEIELMQKLNHPNIVKYIDTIRTQSYLYIALEFMENGSLATVIKKFGSFTESLTAIYITQVLRGLKYLHEQGVLHRDIKGANILTSKDGMVKLADFGVAMKLNEANAEDQFFAGSPYWIAPEIIEMASPTEACDIWSVGCIIIELLTGKPPYFHLSQAAALFRIVQDDYPPIPEGISQALRDFLFNCFQKEPVMRSSAQKLLEHPWLHISSTSKSLEQHATSLLNSSVGSKSEALIDVDADAVMNSVRLHHRELKGNSGIFEAFANNEIKISATLSRDSFDSRGEIDSIASGTSIATEKVEKGGKTFTFQALDNAYNRRVSLQSDSVDSNDSSNARLIRPGDVTNLPRLAEFNVVKTLEDTKEAKLAIIRKPSQLTNIPEVGDFADDEDDENWDADIIDAEFSKSIDLSTEDLKQKVKRLNTSSISASSSGDLRRTIDLKRFDESAQPSKVSSVKTLESNILSPIQGTISLSHYQERQNEEDFDDFVDDFKDSLDSNNLTNLSRTSSFKKVDLNKYTEDNDEGDDDDHGLLEEASKKLSMTGSLKLASSNDETKILSFDFDDDDDDANTSENAFARKLRQKLTNKAIEKGSEDETDEFLNYQFDEKDFKQNEQKDIHIRRSREIVDLLSRIRLTNSSEEELIKLSSQVHSIFDQFPDQRDHLITYHGVMPIVDMFEDSVSLEAADTNRSVSFNTFASYVLMITNKIIENSIRAQEQLSLVGIIPTVMGMFERSRTRSANNKAASLRVVNDVTFEAAKFVHQISLSSSLTLQMLIGAGGLGMLTAMVSFGAYIDTSTKNEFNDSDDDNVEIKETEVKRSDSFFISSLSPSSCSENEESSSPKNINITKSMIIFQMGMNCISKVFSVQSSRTRDFCRLFVKLGLLPHLAVSFQNLIAIFKRSLRKEDSRDCMAVSAFTMHSKSRSEGSAVVSRLQRLRAESSSAALTSKSFVVDRVSVSDGKHADKRTSLEGNYALAIAELFFKFSRSDSVVVEKMSDLNDGVVCAILETLQASELRPLDSGLSGSLSRSPKLLSANTPTSSKRMKASLDPQYLEIIELLLKCLKNIAMEPAVLDDLENAGVMETLVPLLGGPVNDSCKMYILPCIFSMCRLNRRRQEKLSSLGVIHHLKRVISDGSHLKQFALPILLDLAHTSTSTREELWRNDCVAFFVELLKEHYWQAISLNSLTVWMTNDCSNVGSVLIQPNNLSKLIEFFRSASLITMQTIHKPLLDMMLKSADLCTALSASGVYIASLVKHLNSAKEAIVLRSFLKMLQLLHQRHPYPRQLVLDHNLYALVKQFAQSEGQVLVFQIANKLLADFQLSTLS